MINPTGTTVLDFLLNWTPPNWKPEQFLVYQDEQGRNVHPVLPKEFKGKVYQVLDPNIIDELEYRMAHDNDHQRQGVSPQPFDTYDDHWLKLTFAPEYYRVHHDSNLTHEQAMSELDMISRRAMDEVKRGWHLKLEHAIAGMEMLSDREQALGAHIIWAREKRENEAIKDRMKLAEDFCKK